MKETEIRSRLRSVVEHFRRNLPEMYERLSKGAQEGGWTLADEIAFRVALSDDLLKKQEKEELQTLFYAIGLSRKKLLQDTTKVFEENQGRPMTDEEKATLWKEVYADTKESFEMIYSYLGRV